MSRLTPEEQQQKEIKELKAKLLKDGKTAEEIAQFPELLQEAIDTSHKGGTQVQLQNFDRITGEYVSVRDRNTGKIAYRTVEDPEEIYNLLLKCKIDAIKSERMLFTYVLNVCY